MADNKVAHASDSSQDDLRPQNALQSDFRDDGSSVMDDDERYLVRR